MEAEHRLTERQMQNVVALIEALESGKYRQVKRSLRSAEGYCVTGVMCEISGLGTWEPYDSTDKFHFAINYHDGDIWRWLNFAPYDVVNHYGMPLDFSAQIVYLNDHVGVSFADIARRLRIWLDNGAPRDMSIREL